MKALNFCCLCFVCQHEGLDTIQEIITLKVIVRKKLSLQKTRDLIDKTVSQPSPPDAHIIHSLDTVF